ncbi:MAG: hypothetical protein GY762_24055 [Proteobacteria bacterium]|nr:hypothetical protein [Pseudomonadota bacterium]
MSTSINYDIANIENCIVMDTEIGKKYDVKKKKAAYKKVQARLKKRRDIVEYLTAENLNSLPGPRIFDKVGFLPPEIIVLDERVKEMCTLPFWQEFALDGTRVKKYGKCPGYGVHFSCPPHPPKRLIEDQEDLNKSNAFFLLESGPQTLNTLAGGAAPWQAEFLWELKQQMDQKFGKGTLIQTYAAGPCQACHPNMCVTVNDKCLEPEKKTRSLEAVGMPCAVICDDMALLSGDESWKITYIKHWGQPNQTPKTYKLLWGAALKI